MQAQGGQEPYRQEARTSPSPGSARGLDWFSFFIADVQIGFGPFICVYLTTQKWTQTDIGILLMVGSLASLAGQLPGGALVDAARSEKRVAALAVTGIGLSALIIASFPTLAMVFLAKLLHAGASCIVGPALAAISLGLVGHRQIGERLGRNARFASMGAGLTAAMMGAVGYYVSSQAVFYVTAILVVPALIALSRIRSSEIDPVKAHGGGAADAFSIISGLRELARIRPLLTLASGVCLFHLANAAMLPLAGSMATLRNGDGAAALVALYMIVPQLVVMILSPWVGHQADALGRRPLLLLGFGVLPVRGVLFASGTDPVALIAVQLLDGISAAVLAVLVTLSVSDLTRGTGRFNLGLGFVGSVMGIGASLSTPLSGVITDQFGSATAFMFLAMVGLSGFLILSVFMPETQPEALSAEGRDHSSRLETAPQT
jgi:predicted MFS family arabinose efflux permease